MKRRFFFQLFLPLWLALFGLDCATAQAGLIHRYSFNGTGGTTLPDRVGTAHGTVHGGALYLGDGRMLFNGTDGYVDLPDGLISSLTNVSFEIWMNWTGGEDYQAVFDFGLNGRDEAAPFAAVSSLYLTPRSNSESMVFGTRGGAGFYGGPVFTAIAAPPPGREYHLVLTYNFLSNFSAMYLDGKLVDTGPASFPLRNLSDVNNWIGRSNFSEKDFAGVIGIIGDPFYSGTLNEFRIYDHPLEPHEIRTSFSLGPDRLVTELGTLESVSIRTRLPLLAGKTEVVEVLAHYNNVKNVDVTLRAETTLTSSDNLVVQVNTNGTITPFKRGGALLSASFQGRSATLAVQVQPMPARHRYSFNKAPGEIEVTDSLAGKHGYVSGLLAFTGAGELAFDGTGGYVDLPDGLLSVLTDTTIEFWATWSGNAGNGSSEQQLFDFGSQVDGLGETYAAFTPLGGTGSAIFRIQSQQGGVGGIGSDSLSLTGPALTQGAKTHVAITYDFSNNRSRLFINGQPVDSDRATVPLSRLLDYNVWLGRSNWEGDPPFFGSLDEFRIYEGPLSEAAVLASYQAGPDHGGELRFIQISGPSRMTVGSRTQLRVAAQYALEADVDVTESGEVVFASSDPSIATIDALGWVDAVKEGTATLSATYQGSTAELLLLVFEDRPAVLKHRYSFSEAPGSRTVADLVGGAHGTLQGNANAASFSEGRLHLAGSNGYVDLPNHLFTAFSNITLEAWVTWNGDAGQGAVYNQKIFDFGTNQGGENGLGPVVSHLTLTPWGGTGGLRFIAFTNAGSSEVVLNTDPLPFFEEKHVVVVYDYFRGVSKLYVNGELKQTGATPFPINRIVHVNNWLGRSNDTDPYFFGSYNEFRIYSGGLSDAEVWERFQSGPDQVPGSEFRILSITRTAQGNLRLVVQSPFPSPELRLYGSPDLPGASWSVVSGISFSSEGGNQHSAEVAPSGSRRFYRVGR